MLELCDFMEIGVNYDIKILHRHFSILLSSRNKVSLNFIYIQF
jgi:hypothetical protein